MIACRLILSEPASGAWNMALDEALLDSAAHDRAGREAHPTLRIYRWAQPTLSLGYFQCAAEREFHPPSRDCELIRRPSGGGAILHDRELTYALVLPEHIAAARPATQWYFEVHHGLIAALNGVGSLFSNGDDSHDSTTNKLEKRLPTPSPFLCFQRRADGDVLIGDHKIAGSAQRRRRGAILQHGSVLLRKSPFAPELPGIAELTASEITHHELTESFVQQIADRLGFAFSAGATSNAEQSSAKQLQATKYTTIDWTMRR